MRFGITEVRFAGVMVLNQVVPDSPFPDDFASCLNLRLYLENAVRDQAPLHRLGAASGGDGFICRLFLPNDQEQMAVGHSANVVVSQLLRARELEIPDDLAVPAEFLKMAGRARSVAECLLGDLGMAKHVAVLQ